MVAYIYAHQRIFFWKFTCLPEFPFHSFYFNFTYALIIFSLVKYLLDFWVVQLILHLFLDLEKKSHHIEENLVYKFTISFVPLNYYLNFSDCWMINWF